MLADLPSSNYAAKANFRIEVKKLWAHRNAWVSVEIELTEVKLTEVYCITITLTK